MKQILACLDAIAPLITIIFFLRNKVVLKDQAIKHIFLFLVIQLLFNGIAIGISITMKYYFHKMGNNIVFFHLNCLFSTFAILCYFKEIKVIKTRLLIFVLFVTMYIWCLIIGDGIFRFNSIGYSLASLIILILCFKYYYFLLKNPQLDNFFYSHNFWIITGLLTYHVCNFIIFITFSYLAKNTPNTGDLWLFHNVLLAILCMYLIKAVICKKKELMLSSSL